MRNLNRATGILLWSLAAGVIILNILLNIAVDDGFVDNGRDDIAESLSDVHDDEEIWVIANVFDVAVVNVIAVLVGIALYLYFRNRRGGSVEWPVKALAPTLGLIGFLFASVLFTASDAANLALIDLAADFERGGAEGVEAGDPQTAELARTVASLSGALFIGAVTFLGFGLVGFGLAIARPGEGKPVEYAENIPQWAGWLAIVAGIFLIANWLGLVDDALFVVGLVGLIGAMLWLVALGWWFIFKAPDGGEPSAAVPSA